MRVIIMAVNFPRMRTMPAPKKRREPSQEAIESALITQFVRYCVHRNGLRLNTYPEFYRWP